MQLAEFREIVENAQDIVIETDLVGTVLYASPRIEAILGWPRDEFVGNDMFRHVHPDDLERVARVFGAVVAQGEGSVGAETYRHRHRNGSWRWLESSGRVYRAEGTALRAILVTRDVTEHRRVEIEQERFFELSSDLLAMMDTRGILTRVNGAWTHTLGWSRDELVGHSAGELIHPDDLPKTVAEFLRLAASGDPSTGFENRYRHRDGSYRWLSWRSVQEPSLGLTFVLARDVTDQRRHEERQRHSQKMEALGRMAGGVAHDFNNYLTIITGYTEMILNGDEPEHARREMIEEMGGAAGRAALLTRQLLVFSRKQLLETSVLNLEEVLRGMDAMIRSLAGDTIEVSLDVAPDLWPIEANRAQLEQIVMNLLANARDSMPRGGSIRVALANHDATRSLGDRAPGDWVTLVIEDAGTGMDAEMLDRIFEPFFTTKEPEHGTGLGLSLVHGIVNQIGGHIHVDTQRGEGTTFCISLRRASPAVPQPERPPTRDLPRASGERLLLVEDDRQVRSLAARVFEREGYEVLTAANAEEALTLVSRDAGRLDLLVTDVMMKRMDGVELATTLRQDFPKLPVMFLSGYADDRIPADLLDDGCEFVAKPFTPDELRRTCRELLDRTERGAAAVPFA